MLIHPIHQVNQKAASYMWDLEQEKGPQQVQVAALPTEPYDQADLVVLEVSVTDRDAVWNL